MLQEAKRLEGERELLEKQQQVVEEQYRAQLALLDEQAKQQALVVDKARQKARDEQVKAERAAEEADRVRRDMLQQARASGLGSLDGSFVDPELRSAFVASGSHDAIPENTIPTSILLPMMRHESGRSQPSGEAVYEYLPGVDGEGASTSAVSLPKMPLPPPPGRPPSAPPIPTESSVPVSLSSVGANPPEKALHVEDHTDESASAFPRGLPRDSVSLPRDTRPHASVPAEMESVASATRDSSSSRSGKDRASRVRFSDVDADMDDGVRRAPSFSSSSAVSSRSILKAGSPGAVTLDGATLTSSADCDDGDMEDSNDDEEAEESGDNIDSAGTLDFGIVLDFTNDPNIASELAL